MAMEQTSGLAEQARQELLTKGAEKKAARDLVAVREAELDQAELSGDIRRTAEANMKLLSAKLAVARLEGDEKKRVEARKQVWQEECDLAGIKGDKMGEATALVKVRNEGDKMGEATALVKVRNAELELARLEGETRRKRRLLWM
ncbi:hypothetical protein GUITHDRAFT_145617 [Guillardia theta CCMP2712]|uniref:Uncharacterized protein n=1 Tax=Guillardia theta (strain CCMP2712) TaxID=905079 RepID=L1ILJ2_GUITC|nr:hypothetical protein GUITHDRAFT_145617 [Guillardia theta CCMP2712]EKX36665.1 hypothetical protein GUITHDRAFT_145617 [Guillardia theta CCMP2712]|eukprot:XP_005823645.1 hypothetical protein GUITHDRAFT_145617 [Guillardia theta CCMP2712]